MKLAQCCGIVLVLYSLVLTACDRRTAEAEHRIDAAAAEATCEAAKRNVLMLINVAGGADNIESVARLAEEGKLPSISASKLEGEIARQLYKYQSSWAVPIKSRHLENGILVTDYSERDELAWKIGKEICAKLALN